METLAEAIIEMRGLGMTQEEIADATGLSQGYISDVETGKRGARTPAETLLHVLAVKDDLIATRRSTDKEPT